MAKPDSDINIDKNEDGSKDVAIKIETGETIKIHMVGENLTSQNDKPSIEGDNLKIWTNATGSVHRLSGPATIETKDDGTTKERYFINSAPLTKEEWEKHPEVLVYNKSNKNK